MSKVVSLWKLGWHKIPETMGAMVLMGIGACLLTYSGIKNSYKPERMNMYKYQYTVKRAEDIKNPESDIYN